MRSEIFVLLPFLCRENWSILRRSQLISTSNSSFASRIGGSTISDNSKLCLAVSIYSGSDIERSVSIKFSNIRGGRRTFFSVTAYDGVVSNGIIEAWPQYFHVHLNPSQHLICTLSETENRIIFRGRRQGS